MLSAYRRRSSTRSRMVLLGTAAALGVCLSVSAGGLVQSQPAAAQPAPVAAPAAVQPAPAPGPLRPDQVKLLAGALAEAESHGFPAGAFGPAPTDEAQLRRAIVAAGAPRGAGAGAEGPLHTYVCGHGVSRVRVCVGPPQGAPA